MRKENLPRFPRLAAALLPLCLVVALAFLAFSCRREDWEASGSRDSEPGQPRKTRIMVSLVQDESDWCRRAEEWARDAVEELEKKDSYLEISKDNNEQYMLFQKLTQENGGGDAVDAVVLLTTGYQSRLPGLCAELARRGGVVVTVVSSNIVYPQPHNSDILVYPLNPDILVSGDNAKIGQESARSIVNALGGEASATGRILALTDPQDSALRVRLMNFQDHIRLYPGLKVDVINYREEAPSPKDAMKRILEREDCQYDAVWTGWDGILIPAFQGYRESGGQGVKIFAGAGGFPLVARWIEDSTCPEIASDFTYPPRMLHVAIQATARKVQQRRQSGAARGGSKEAPEIIILPTEIITPDSAKRFRNKESEAF
ncbi:MAG: sugar ABC transporter substrate-binding protein [Oligosphaeraceae bacterium]